MMSASKLESMRMRYLIYPIKRLKPILVMNIKYRVLPLHTLIFYTMADLIPILKTLTMWLLDVRLRKCGI